MLYYANHFYRISITRREVDEFLSLTNDQIAEMERADFLDGFYIVTKEVLTLEQKVKDLKAVFKRMHDEQFLALAEDYEGSILQLQDIVLQVTEAKPGKPYAKILAALVKVQPELQELVAELTEAELAKLTPTKKVKKYHERDEPKTWKKLPHEPLAAVQTADMSFYELTEMGMWEDAVEEMLLDHINHVQQITDELQVALAA